MFKNDRHMLSEMKRTIKTIQRAETSKEFIHKISELFQDALHDTEDPIRPDLASEILTQQDRAEGALRYLVELCQQRIRDNSVVSKLYS